MEPIQATRPFAATEAAERNHGHAKPAAAAVIGGVAFSEADLARLQQRRDGLRRRLKLSAAAARVRAWYRRHKAAGKGR